MNIFLKNISIIASVGIYKHEKINPTKIIISASINYNFEKNNIVDYDLILSIIRDTSGKKHFNYIEELAHELCEKIKNNYKQINSIKIKVQKCIFENILDEISVECEL